MYNLDAVPKLAISDEWRSLIYMERKWLMLQIEALFIGDF